MRILCYDEWLNKLTDEELESLELENKDLFTAYEDFVSDAQDEAYHQYKDDKLLDLEI